MNMNTKSSQQLSISMNSASTIATCLKEAMRNIDRELKKTKDSAVGEMTLAVLHTKRPGPASSRGVITTSMSTQRSPGEWEHLSCPVCESISFTRLFEKGGEPFARCDHCSLIMINPRPVYSDIIHTYTHGYSTHYIDKHEKKLRRARRMVRRLSRIVAGGRWLDVGCSAGFTLQAAREAGF